MSKDSKDPIILSGRVFVTSSLTEIAPSRALPSGKRFLQAGDLKIWSHLTQSASTAGAGIFRGAVYNGTKWCKFRLNRVAGDHTRYDSYDDRRHQLGPCVADLVRLAGNTVCWIENSYGVYRFDEAALTAKQPAVGKTSSNSSERGGTKSGAAEQLTLFD